VPLFKIFLFLAPALFRVAARQRDLTMTGLLWLRAARRRSRIFEHALQKIAYHAAALISHENMRPLSTNGRRSNIRVFELVHSCFRISLVNANALATIASVVGLVATATFHKQLKNKQQITGGKRGTRKQDARPWSPACGGTPGPIAD